MPANDVAQPYVTGAVDVFVGLGSGGSAVYLGSTRGRPRIREMPAFSPVENDIAGDKPYDMVYGGSDCIVMARFSRFKASVLNSITARPNAQAAYQGVGVAGGQGGTTSPSRGTNIAGDIGTLMVTEGKAYPLWLRFPYTVLKSAYGNQEPGYYFPAAFLMGPDEHEDLGTTARTEGLVFYAARVLTITTNGPVWQCYNNLLANFVGLPASV